MLFKKTYALLYKLVKQKEWLPGQDYKDFPDLSQQMQSSHLRYLLLDGI